MIPILKYFWLTLKHKYFVFIAGLKIGTPIWRLIMHDMSKLMPFELPKYGRQFFGKADRPYEFIQAWMHHQNHNDHHWEYWIPRTGHGRCTPPVPAYVPIPMTEDAVKEMVADWFGATRAYYGKWPNSLETWEWHTRDRKIMEMHPDTSALADKLLEKYFRGDKNE